VPIRDGIGYAGKEFMKIAAIQSGIGPRQALVRSPTVQRAKSAREAGRNAGPGKIRHVLHGWRILLAPIVAQVLERSGEAPARIPAQVALDAYLRVEKPPPRPRVLRDI
jgi:hypothetical protein